MNPEMKQMSGCMAAIFIAAFAVAACAGDRAPRLAPPDPAFVSYQEEQFRVKPGPSAAAGRGYGHIPPPANFSHLKNRPADGKRAALPAIYDMRTQGRVTPVKNQSPWGTCWAFASYGSLESCLMPGEERWFSVNNLANNHGFDFQYDDGGNFMMAAAYMARWSGPVDESDDPYSNGPSNSPPGLAARKHLQEMLVLPSRSGALDNAAIKQAVLDYGAVYVSMCAEFDTNLYFNTANSAFYYTGTSRIDHAVAIVGWDDTYAASNFLQRPPGDGAFIVRNSWGTRWGDGGYFYGSYYDTKLALYASAVFNRAEAADNYASVYQYDPLGWIGECGYYDTNAWAANIFMATNNDILRAVGFCTTDSGAGYEIYVYTGVSSGNPMNGALALSQAGTCAQAGFHTAVLNYPVALTSGARFSVIVKLSNSSYVYPLAIEYAISGYSSRAKAWPMESYISHFGTFWSDLTVEIDSTANNCIKAFCGYGGATSTAEAVTADFDGDRLADPAVYLPDSGTWKIKLSSANYSLTALAGYLGGSGLAALAADFDGDGLADPAVCDAATGVWQVKLSTAGYGIVTLADFLGAAGSQALAADFDGDRLADPAVCLTTAGDWTIRLSTANFSPIVLQSFLGK